MWFYERKSMQEFLGQGSFGFVTMVRKKVGAMEGCLFALKSLSKLGVVEGGQVQHIKDEKSVGVCFVSQKSQKSKKMVTSLLYIHNSVALTPPLCSSRHHATSRHSNSEGMGCLLRLLVVVVVAVFQYARSTAVLLPLERSKRLRAATGAGAVQPPVYLEAIHNFPRRKPSILPDGVADRGRAVVRCLRSLKRFQFR